MKKDKINHAWYDIDSIFIKKLKAETSIFFTKIFSISYLVRETIMNGATHMQISNNSL